MSRAAERHRIYNLTFVASHQDDWREIEKVYEQVKRAWSMAPEDTELLDFVWTLRDYQYRRNLWLDHLAWVERAMTVTAGQDFEVEHGGLLNNLGAVYYHLGNWHRALECYSQALAVTESTGEPVDQAAA